MWTSNRTETWMYIELKIPNAVGSDLNSRLGQSELWTNQSDQFSEQDQLSTESALMNTLMAFEWLHTVFFTQRPHMISADLNYDIPSSHSLSLY